MREEFEISPLPPTLNEIIRSARGNRYASAGEKEDWTAYCASYCVGRSKFSDQVWIAFIWKVHRRRDPDNTCAAIKFILDGMVWDGMIAKDSLMVIRSPVVHEFQKPAKGQEESVIVRISDAPLFRLEAI